MKEQFVKVTVIMERTYLIPFRDGRNGNGDGPDEVVRQWFGDPDSLNWSHVSRENCRLGGGDVIKSAEITQIIDLPNGTL